LITTALSERIAGLAELSARWVCQHAHSSSHSIGGQPVWSAGVETARLEAGVRPTCRCLAVSTVFSGTPRNIRTSWGTATIISAENKKIHARLGRAVARCAIDPDR